MSSEKETKARYRQVLDRGIEGLRARRVRDCYSYGTALRDWQEGFERVFMHKRLAVP